MATVWERLFSCLFYVHGILRTYYQLSCIYTATIMSCAIFLSIEQQLNSLCLINTTIPTELTVSSCCPCQILTWSHSLNSSDWTSESEVRFLKNHFSRKVGRTSSAEGMPIAEKNTIVFSFGNCLFDFFCQADSPYSALWKNTPIFCNCHHS